MNDGFFPEKSAARPMIYAYSENNPEYRGYLKVGFSSAGVERRVAEQFPVLKPGADKPYRIVFSESAMYADGGSFTDHRVHAALALLGRARPAGPPPRMALSASVFDRFLLAKVKDPHPQGLVVVESVCGFREATDFPIEAFCSSVVHCARLPIRRYAIAVSRKGFRRR